MASLKKLIIAPADIGLTPLGASSTVADATVSVVYSHDVWVDNQPVPRVPMAQQRVGVEPLSVPVLASDDPSITEGADFVIKVVIECAPKRGGHGDRGVSATRIARTIQVVTADPDEIPLGSKPNMIAVPDPQQYADVMTAIQAAAETKAAAAQVKASADSVAASAAGMKDAVAQTAADLAATKKLAADMVGPTDAGVAQLVQTGSQTSAAISAVTKARDNLFYVTSYGAVGDGTTNDTAKIQATINAAPAGSTVVFPAGRVFLVDSITPKAGVRLSGYGATLRGASAGSEGVVSTQFTRIDGWSVEGFTIDAANTARRCVFVYGSGVTIKDTVCYGLENPSVTKEAIRFYYGASDCTVMGNTVTLGVDQPFGTYTVLPGIMFTGRTASSYAGLDTGNDIVAAQDVCYRNRIIDNKIVGGTHGLHLQGFEQGIVQGNYVERVSHRCILMSPQTSYNDVSNNVLRNFGSAAIHIAYGSNGNHVHNNTIYSDGSIMVSSTGGEGAIQVYVHCQDNRIFGNQIRTKSTRYGIYTAVYCNGTSIECNDIEWTLRAGIAVETDWSASPATGESYARPNFVTAPNTSWSSWANGRGMDEITVRNNRVRRSTLGVVNTGIYVSQVGAAPLSNVSVEGNIIDSQNTSGHDLYVYCADASKLTSASIDRNQVQPLEILQIGLPNESMQLVSYAGNGWQTRQYTVASGVSTISWALSDYRAMSGADTITSFTGLLLNPSFAGRILTLRMKTGAVLKSGVGISVKGGATSAATTDADMITFRVIGGSAIETSRTWS